jgi:hypothetical protein
VTLRLVAECLDAFFVRANQNEVTLIQVPGHCGSPGNEKTDELARHGAAMMLISPEPALGIPRCSARVAIKNWTAIQHYTTRKNLPGCRHGKLFISIPCKERADDLLKLGRHQLRMVDAFLMGHAPVKKHLNIMGLFDRDLNCRFCKLETETGHHIICCRKALARQHYNFFGKFFAEPKDISTASKGLSFYKRYRFNESVLREST